MTGWASVAGPVGAPEEECDVLVVGSGAGGLSAAVTAAYHGLRVVVVEKAARCGGATGRSGGWMWTPGNPFARADGVREDVMDGPRRYLQGRLGSNFDGRRVDAFLRAAPDMVSFFHCRTALRLTPGSWVCDIHGSTPGAGTGHRSVAPAPLDARTLAPPVAAVVPRQLYETSFLGMGIMAGPDLRDFLAAAQLRPRGLAHATRRVAGHVADLLRYGHGQHLVNGAALVGRLLQSAHDLGVVVHVRSGAASLVRDGEGRVVGAIVRGPSGERVVAARRAVVLAAGGFAADPGRRVEVFPHGTGAEHHTLAPDTDRGDGLSMGEWAGGHVDRSVASPVAWCPVSLVPYRNGRAGVFPHILDRGKPGVIGVLSDGRRFVNEADGYHDYVLAMLGAVPQDAPVQSWLVADRRFVRRYPLGMAKPRPVPLWPYLRNGYLARGATIEELATRCGIDPAGLARTVERFNAGARRGEDPDFGRGSSPFNRSAGDPRVGPNPSLAPLDRPPFYAVRVLPGSFGTFLGLQVDESARVLDAQGRPVDGLYAVGTDQSSVFGGHYPSGGINLGPAMVFGYLAGRHLANAEDREVDPVEAEVEARRAS